MPQSSFRRLLSNRDFLAGILAGFLFLYLAVNTIISQTISPIYFNLIKNDKGATTEYLHYIKLNEVFPQELETYKNIFGQEFENEIFVEDRAREAKINKLEQVYRINPRARDIVYSLYLLYNEKGDMARSQDFLRQAQALDPSIGK